MKSTAASLLSHPDVGSIPPGDLKVSGPGCEETVNVCNMLLFLLLAVVCMNVGHFLKVK